MKQQLQKIIAQAGLVGLIFGPLGYAIIDSVMTNNAVYKEKVTQEEVARKEKSCSFNNFGEIADSRDISGKFIYSSVADFNGDGKPDVLLISSCGKVYIRENKMPQKTRTSEIDL